MLGLIRWVRFALLGLRPWLSPRALIRKLLPGAGLLMLIRAVK